MEFISWKSSEWKIMSKVIGGGGEENKEKKLHNGLHFSI
jgi:hypothetical protein